MDIKKFIRDVLANLIANILVVAGGSIAIVLAFFQQLPIYQLLLLIIGTFGLILWVINQIAVWRVRNKKGLAESSDQEIENTVRNWLDVPHLSVTRQVNPETLFQFDVVVTNGIPVTVKRRKIDPLLFHIGVLITWKDEDKVKLAKLQEPIRSNLISNLRIEMARLGIQYSGIGHPLNAVLLVESIPLDDSLTRFYFLQRISFVVRASSLVAELIEQSLRKFETSESTPHKEDSRS